SSNVPSGNPTWACDAVFPLLSGYMGDSPLPIPFNPWDDRTEPRHCAAPRSFRFPVRSRHRAAPSDSVLIRSPFPLCRIRECPPDRSCRLAKETQSSAQTSNTCRVSFPATTPHHSPVRPFPTRMDREFHPPSPSTAPHHSPSAFLSPGRGVLSFRGVASRER